MGSNPTRSKKTIFHTPPDPQFQKHPKTRYNIIGMNNMDKIKIGGIYEHFKKKHRYKVLGVAYHSETLKKLVIYKSISGSNSPEFPVGTIWARPLEMFTEIVERNSKKFKRFKLVTE